MGEAKPGEQMGRGKARGVSRGVGSGGRLGLTRAWWLADKETKF